MKKVCNEGNSFLEQQLKNLRAAKSLVEISFNNMKKVNTYLKDIDIITPATSVDQRLKKLLKDIDDEIANVKDMIAES